jgi:hypothetical protein
MDSRFNIPAPAVVKLGSDVSVEMGRRLKVTVGPAPLRVLRIEQQIRANGFEMPFFCRALKGAGRGRGGLGWSGSIKAGTEKNFRVFPRLPVPESDTGGWVEYTQAREWNLVKELGNLAP